jgi:glycosyltransferase involved in cell wall biosynthesis
MQAAVVDRPLHIGVDARELTGKRTGVGRYLWHVLHEWNATGWPHRLSLFAPDARPPDLEPLSASVTWVHDRSGKRGTWWEQSRLPGLITRAGVDVFFAPAYTAPLLVSCPLVVAIYDVSFFAHPEWFAAREGWRRRWLTRRAAHRARVVVTCSEFSAVEIARYAGIARDRIVVAYPGGPDVPADARPAHAREPLVLFAGSLFTRRRIPELIDAFAIVARRHPEARLVLAGDNRTQPPVDPRQIAAAAGIADRVAWREYVDERTLVDLYRRARVFAFLSDYEGFGMPPLEALAHGVPSVLLDTAVSREAYAGAALLVAPTPASIAAALESLLTDSATHQTLVERGRAALGRFTWARAAATIRRAIETAAS